MIKDQKILDVLLNVSNAFPEEKYKISNNWDADLEAIGICNSKSEQILIYISTYKMTDENYYFECEMPSNQEPYYLVTSKGHVQGIKNLLSIIEKHIINVN